LALDAMPLDVSGSAILSGLNLDSLGSDADMELVSDAGRPGERAGKGGKAAKLQADDEFNLTPIAEGGLDDQDSSSQVIALDGDEPAGPGGGGNGLLDDFEGGVGDVEWNPDGEGVAAEGLDVSPYGGAIAVRSESEYSLMNLLGLGSAAMLLALGSMLLIDIVRNIWSWNQPFALNSPLLDGLCGLFGLK
jgi:hypothetical protein